MRVLALVPGGISEQLLFFPTLATLKQAIPEVEIDVVIEPRAKAAYEVCQAVNLTILFDYAANNSPADWSNLLGVLRDPYYDVALCFSPDFSVGFCLWLTGIGKRLGYAGSGGQLFFTDKVALKEKQYQAHQYHDLLQGLQITAPCPEPAITVKKASLDWAAAEKARLGLEGGYVLIEGGDEPNRYPIDSWQAIIQDLQSRQPDLPVVVTRLPGSEFSVDTLAQRCPGIKVSRPNTLGDCAAMVAGANLLLCLEGIAMHLAVGLQVYTLALFGDGNPTQLLPQSDRVLSLQGPQGKVDQISPQAVLDKVFES